MITKTLYKYNRPDGGITVSPIEPECEYTTMVRLIADDGKLLTNDNVTFSVCTDVSSDERWIEVEDHSMDNNEINE